MTSSLIAVAYADEPTKRLLKLFRDRELGYRYWGKGGSIGYCLGHAAAEATNGKIAEFAIPTALAEENLRFIIRTDECGLLSIRGGAKRLCHTVAGPKGEQLRPFEIGQLPDRDDWHRAARFELGGPAIVRWKKIPKQGDGALSITRYSLQREGGRVFLHSQIVMPPLHTGRPETEPVPVVEGQWQPAVDALFARLACDNHRHWPHYYRDLKVRP